MTSPARAASRATAWCPPSRRVTPIRVGHPPGGAAPGSSLRKFRIIVVGPPDSTGVLTASAFDYNCGCGRPSVAGPGAPGPLAPDVADGPHDAPAAAAAGVPV